MFIKIAGGEVIPEIALPPSATVLQLKERIKEVLDVEVDRQTLQFCPSTLENHRSLESYGFEHDGLVMLDLEVAPSPGQPKFRVAVRSASMEDHFRVTETQNVEDLKSEISRRWGIPPQMLTLFRLSKKMEDNHLLSKYYVSRHSEVKVEITIEPR